MNYYYFEIYCSNKLFFKEIFSTNTEEEALKYAGYREQAVREIRQLNEIISSHYTKLNLHHVTTDEIVTLQQTLSDISYCRSRIVENIRTINNF